MKVKKNIVKYRFAALGVLPDVRKFKILELIPDWNVPEGSVCDG
jgi:hypothetical protein